MKVTFNKFQNDWLEASFYEMVQLPDVEVPEKPALFDADGKEVQAAEPARAEPGALQRVGVAFTSYHPTQLDLLRADAAKHGADLAEHEAMLAEWVAAYVPPPAPVPTPAERWAAIKAIRDSKTQTGGYKVGANWFHSDTFSRTQQMGLVMMGAGMPPGLQWKTMGGAFVPMTPTLAQQIFAAAAQQDSALFAHAEALKADAAADIEAGWPATFQG